MSSEVPQKLLHQVGWAMGQTDGEVGDQLVKQLVNVELDRPGELRPRSNLAQSDATSAASVLRVFRMSADPAGTSDSGWQFELKATTIDVRKVGGASVEQTLTIGYTVGALTEIRVYGGLAIMAAVDASGDPVGTFTIWYNSTNTRFRSPYTNDLMLHGGSGQETVNGTWVLSPMIDVEPQLVATHFEDEVENHPFGSLYYNDTFVQDLIDTATDELMDTNNDDAVLLLVGIDHENEDYSAEVATELIELEYRVQFKYGDGRTSKLSNPVFVTVPGTENEGNRAYFTIMVLASIDPSIVAINVFRKIANGNSGYELMMSAKVYSGADDIQDDASSFCNAHTRLSSDGSDDHDAAIDYQDARGFSVEYGGVAEYSKVHVRGYQSAVGSGEPVRKTRGWREDEGGAYVYFPDHYFWLGQFQVKVESQTTDKWAEWIYNGSGIFDAIGDGVPNVRIVGGASELGLPTIYFTSGGSIAFASDIPYWIMRGLMGVEATGFDANGYNGATDTVSSWSAVTAVAAPADRRPIVLMVDRGQPMLTTYEDLEGASDDELVAVEPRHIAVVSNRLICLNVVWDDRDHKSRLAWSNYGRYGSFTNTSYDELGFSDDSSGVGIAVFGSRILILMAAAAFAMDVSGGSDMAWRRVGSWNSIGCLGPHAYVETPYGVVFCDTDKAYLWNGERMFPITENEQRTIATTYKTYTASGMGRVCYRPSLHQVWIPKGNKVLVYDILRDAWHEHEYTELNASASIIGIYDISGAEYVEYLLSGTYYARLISVSDQYSTIGWKIDTGPITMGASEIVKKLKRVYVEEYPITGAGTFTVTANGDSATTVTGGGSGRISTLNVPKTARGSSVQLVVEVPQASAWKGTIRSLGLSYKPKRLK